MPKNAELFSNIFNYKNRIKTPNSEFHMANLACVDVSEIDEFRKLAHLRISHEFSSYVAFSLWNIFD